MCRITHQTLAIIDIKSLREKDGESVGTDSVTVTETDSEASDLDSNFSHDSLSQSQFGAKSCMKVRTLEDSLLSATKNDIFRAHGVINNSSSRSLNRSVSFDQIEIREYSQELGDNPSVSYGVPLSIGWDYDPDVIIIPFEEYESTRASRRTKRQMVLPVLVREIMLKKSGYSGQEIREAIKEVEQIKGYRARTIRNLKFSRLEEGLESARRKFKRGVLQYKTKCSPIQEVERCVVIGTS